MKKIALLSLLILLISCSDKTPDANGAELEKAASVGREMGERANILPEGSMEKQNAILEIRAKETALREAGFPSCADTFAVEAAKKLGYN